MGLLIFVIVIIAFLIISATNTATNQIAADKIRNELINKKFEEELVEKINTLECREKIINIIKDDLEYIYGDEWKEVFKGRWQAHCPVVCTFYSREDVILTLLLSKSGLLPSAYEMKRFSVHNYKHANVYEHLLIMQCVNRNVKQKRKWEEHRIVFVPGMQREYGRKNAPLKPDYVHPSAGHFQWNFDVSCENVKYVMQLDDATLINNCKEDSFGPRNKKSRPYKDNYVI